MPISALPTPPSRSDSPQDFSDRADALLGALPGFVTEANALQSDVNAKESIASSHATVATDKAAEAQGYATAATTKAGEAAASAIAASAAASNAEIAFDSFDDKYLGSKASDPTTDNDGNALLTGALYWNTSVGAVRVWNGSAWLSMAADASIVDFQQAGTGATVRTAQDKMRELVSVKDFGAVGDGVADDTAVIQAAIDYASANSTKLYFAPGVYKHTSTLIWKNGAHYFGPSVNISNALGAVLVYTGPDDANVINNPLNASTYASIRIEGITFLCNSLASGKALFYDTGSSYLYIEHCKFNIAGVGAFGLVLHQTEICTVSKCVFEPIGDIGLGALIRLADGPILKHPTASMGYTNRITITDNQINPALGGAQAIGLWDDGGLVHTIKDNNFNGGSIGIYLIRPYPVEISSNEIEGYTTAGISCGLPDAGLTGLRIVGNYLLAFPPALSFANNSITELTYTDNVISVLGGGPCEANIAGSPDAKIFATNNKELSAGNNPYNNYLQRNVDTVAGVFLAGSSTAGTQTYSQNTMTWRLLGDVCFFNAHIILTNKDPSTAGNIRLTGLPFPARVASAQTTSVPVSYLSDITLTAGYTQLGGIIQPAAFLPAAGIANTTQIMVSGVYPI